MAEARDAHAAEQTEAAREEAVMRSVTGMGRVAALTSGGLGVVAVRDASAAMRRSDTIIRDRFTAALEAGMRYCPHAGAVLVLWWSPVPGAPVTCKECTAAWLAAHVVGTAEDDTCDVCRRPMGGRDYQERHLMFSDDPPPGYGKPIPTLTVPYAVCTSCLAAERSYP
jgi:hypothetical protein